MMAFALRVYNPKTAVLQQFTLPASGTIQLGNTAQSDIHLPHPFVSDHHATVDVRQGRVYLVDLDSDNGTAVNGHRISPNQPIRLHPDDLIDIGLFQLTFLALSAPEETEVAKPAAETAVPPTDNQETAVGKKPKSNQFPEPSHIFTDPSFSRYVQYLPGIYDVPFMHHFLSLFESLLEPIIWRIDTRDLLLDGELTDTAFLDWLAHWYAFTFDHSWTEAKKRRLLQAAPQLFGQWGTVRAMKKMLEIYSGVPITIVDDERMPPFVFRIEVSKPFDSTEHESICRLVNQHKPAHTSFELTYTE